MPNYECKRCGYIINRITNYSKHINTKRICKAIFSDIDTSLLLGELDYYIKHNLKCGIISKMNHNEPQMNHNEPQKNNENKIYQCNYCSLIFTTNSHLRRHERKYCKIQKKLINENKITYLENKQLVTINNNNGDTNKIQNNNTINNKINADVRVNVYGKEQYAYITQQDAIRCHICPYESIPRLASDIFFNKNHPENRSVKWKNKKKPLMQILQRGNDGPEWVNKDKNWVLCDMNDKAYNIIDYQYKPSTTTLTESQKTHYEKFQNDYDTQNKNTIKKLNKETERLILNYELSGFT